MALPNGVADISRGSSRSDHPRIGGQRRSHPGGPGGVLESCVITVDHQPFSRGNSMSTFLSLHYHLVFSTKNRAPLIKPLWIERMHEYLSGTVVGLDGFPQETGGVADHVHLLEI